MSKRHVTRFSLSALLLLLLSAFIVGCGSSTASTPPKATATATATAPTPTPVPTVALTTYKGTGYTIGYPQGWTASDSGSGHQLQISDAAQDHLGIQTDTGLSSSSSKNTQLMQIIAKSVLNMLKQGSKDYKEVGTTPKTTVGGTTWDQNIVTLTDPKLGPIQFNMLYTQNPKLAGQIVVIIYGATTKTFDTVNKESFQPMLQSFQFQA